jgi:hypothetical protein
MYFPFQNPGWYETISLHLNEDFGYNNGFEIQFGKSRGKYFTFGINYTYSVAEGSSSEPLERVGVEEANRQTLKFFPLDYDQRHALSAQGTTRYKGLMANLLFQYSSGLPYTKGIRGATEPYEINNMRLPDQWTLDLKLNYRVEIGNIALTPYLEIYNLTDRENIVYVDPFTGEPDYIEGRTEEWADNPLNYGSPRIIYLGLDFNL